MGNFLLNFIIENLILIHLFNFFFAYLNGVNMAFQLLFLKIGPDLFFFALKTPFQYFSISWLLLQHQYVYTKADFGGSTGTQHPGHFATSNFLIITKSLYLLVTSMAPSESKPLIKN